MPHHRFLRVSLTAAFMALLASACSLTTTSDAERTDPDCPDLDLEAELQDNINPVSLLEEGHFLFDHNQPLPKRCIKVRVCQINEFTRQEYGQSCYISLDERGGAEIERQFPDLVEAITEQRGDDRMIDLNRFCRAVEERTDEEGPPPNTIVPADRDPRERGSRPLNSNR